MRSAKDSWWCLSWRRVISAEEASAHMRGEEGAAVSGFMRSATRTESVHCAYREQMAFLCQQMVVIFENRAVTSD
jgi:hypothetical protein